MPVLFFLAIAVGLGFVLLRGEARSSAGEARRETSGVSDAAAEVALPGALETVAIPLDEAARRAVTPATSRGHEARTEARRDATAIVGRVVDESGLAVEDASVFSARSLDGLTWAHLASPDDPGHVTTDAEGAFRIELERAGETYLGVRASGFAPVEVPGIKAAAGAETVLANAVILARSHPWTGIVLDEAGAPIEDARVLVRDNDTLLTRPHRPETGGERTGSDGSFRLDQLPLGTVTLDVSHTEFATHRQDIDASRPGHVSIRLQRGAAIEGRIEGAPPDIEQPLTVVGRPRTYQTDQSTRSAAIEPDGSFRLPGLPVDSTWQLLALLGEGDGNWMKSVKNRVSLIVEVEAGRRDVVLEWQEGGTLRFQVVDASTREPVEYLVVSFGSGPTNDRRIRPPDDSVGGFQQGQVHIANLRPDLFGRPFTLVVDATGYERWSREELEAEAERDVDLGTIELKPVPRMTIIVLDDRDDTPVKGARVRWAKDEAEAETAAPGGSRGTSSRRDEFKSQVEYGTTDEQGRVVFDGAAGSTVALSIWKTGFANAGLSGWKLPDSADAERVVRLVQGGAVLVSTTDSLGQALGGRTIEQRAPATDWDFLSAAWSSRAVHHVTDADGRVLLEHLTVGEHAFRIVAADVVAGKRRATAATTGADVDEEDALWSRVEVVEGETSALELSEEPRASLTGRITERVEPLRQATVWLRVNGPGHNSDAWQRFLGHRATLGAGVKLHTDRDGRYSVDDLEPGDYVLRIERGDRAMAFEVELTLGVGETRRDLDVGLAVLEGRVVDPSGSGVADIPLWVRPATGNKPPTRPGTFFLAGSHLEPNDASHTITDATGAYAFRGVATDTELFVIADVPGWQFAHSGPVTVVGERLDDVDIEIYPAGALEIRIQNRDGAFLDGARIDYWRTDDAEAGEPEKKSTEIGAGNIGGLPPERTITIEGLAPGTWRVRARDRSLEPGVSDAEGEVEVVAGETTRIELVLPN